MENSRFLEGTSITLYRTGVGIALYITADRPGIQNTVRLLARSMQTTTDLNLQQVRLTRYLLGTRDYSLRVSTAGDCNILKVYSDSEHAGDKNDRKSVSAALFVCGGATLHSYSRTQNVVSLSSA